MAANSDGGHRWNLYTEPTILVEVRDKIGHMGAYHVHKSVLTEHSKFFRDCFSKDDKDVATNKISIEVAELYLFPFLVDWLYRHYLPNMETWSSVYLPAGKTMSEYEWEIDLYLIAHELQIRSLKSIVLNLAVDWFAKSKTSPSYSAIIDAFKRVPPGCPFLQFLVDAHCLHWILGHDNDKEGSLIRKLPATFISKMMDKYQKLSKKKSETITLNAADYTEDESEDESEDDYDTDETEGQEAEQTDERPRKKIKTST
ncbi:hypothetical protein CC80DRAFT_590412 [Byssothecium circinans]|uniref:BTB domain-containing protein n=1 Tax=Byssothecium circinans TaxID=147558 RepID=A0A6A5UB40_9PLEO|nr:hypothetical protein CC80DRAFT_590412 [Byssothecium circinans]